LKQNIAWKQASRKRSGQREIPSRDQIGVGRKKERKKKTDPRRGREKKKIKPRGRSKDLWDIEDSRVNKERA